MRKPHNLSHRYPIVQNPLFLRSCTANGTVQTINVFLGAENITFKVLPLYKNALWQGQQ